MKSRAFYVVLCLALHLTSEGIPTSTVELIGAMIVAWRAWDESAARAQGRRRECERRQLR
jgi:hypothetical protein